MYSLCVLQIVFKPFELNAIPIKSVKVESIDFKLISPSLVDDDRSKAISRENCNYCMTIPLKD